MDAAGAALWFLPFVTVICIWASWSDISTMKIPNMAVAALLAVFVVGGIFMFPLVEYGYRLLHFVVLLIVLFFASSLGLMGAGDAKFIAAMGPYVALTDVTFYSLILAVSVIISFTLHRVMRAIPAIRRATPDWQSWDAGKKFPFGFPLSLSMVIYLSFLAFS